MLGQRPDGLQDSVFVHSLALVESTAIGAGTRVWGFAHVMKGSQVGDGCNIGEHCFVEAGARIGNRVTVKNGISIWDKVTVEDDVFLGPHAVFTNDLMPRAFLKKGPSGFLPTLIRQGASIGAGAVIVCGVTIGRYAFVAAGAVVTKDIPDYGIVKGNPARLSGFICKCTKTRFPVETGGKGQNCPECGELK